MRQKHLIYALICSCVLVSFVVLIAFSQQKSLRQLDIEVRNKKSALDTEVARHKKANDSLNEMIRSVKRKYDKLEGISVNTAPAGDYISVSHRGASAISVIQTTYTLSDSLKEALINMEKQREIAENLWAIDVDNAFVAYENAVAAWNSHPQVSPGEHIVVYDLIKPHVESLYVCQGPCYQSFETLPLAMYTHSETCSHQHGSSGSSYSYWSCEYNVCPAGNKHWKECRASACSVLFPPPEHEHEWDTYDHKVKCTECGKKYFTCQSSTCPDSSTHSGSGSGSGGSTPPTDNTPNCQDCTSHCSSPCSCTNSGTCNGTVTDNTPNCSGCTSHCSSPCSCSDSGTCNGTVAAPPPPEPEPPTLVSCGARGWTGCMELVASSTKHKVPSCSGCGSTYWTCSAYASNHTDLKTCRYSECRQQWKKCASAPVCNKPYRKRNGLKCWAQ